MGLNKRSFNFFALAATGSGISGSDRIFIEFAKKWSQKYLINIFVTEEGLKMCKSQNLAGKNIFFSVSRLDKWSKLRFVIYYITRILEGIRLGLFLKLKNSNFEIVYSASEFWMDVIPPAILKIRCPKIIWLASWYQTAPRPWIGFKEGRRDQSYKLNALIYWLSQTLIKPLISTLADFVLVNNEEEKKNFQKIDKKEKIIVVFGGVSLAEINEYKDKNKNLPKIYHAVFQGRLHPQKGILELIDIWKLVVDKIPEAKLAIIGDGPLMHSVRERIKRLNLENNIELFGFIFDGLKKYKIFSQSKIVVHPAYYDSGGMSAAEAMAFGLPCIGFGLKAYITYYPKGMIKVKIDDKEAFAKEIIKMLGDRNYRNKIGQEAFDMINQNWSWDIRVANVLRRIN